MIPARFDALLRALASGTSRRRVLLGLAGLGGSLWPAATNAVGAVCTSDADCAAGQLCLSGACYTPGVGCNSDADCPSSQVCAGGTCRPAPTAVGGEGCTSDVSCGPGTICAGGVCRPAPCQSDADCVPGLVCANGGCQPSGSTVPPGCTSTADCRAGLVCLNGVCATPPTPTPTPRPTPTGPEHAHPAAIHQGTCARLSATGAFQLFDVSPTPPATPAAAPHGAASAIPVLESATTIHVQLTTLLASPYALAITASATDPTVVACGDVGGTLLGKDLAIGLAGQNGSGYGGIAWLRGQGAATLVYVFLARNLTPASTP